MSRRVCFPLPDSSDGLSHSVRLEAQVLALQEEVKSLRAQLAEQQERQQIHAQAEATTITAALAFRPTASDAFTKPL